MVPCVLRKLRRRRALGLIGPNAIYDAPAKETTASNGRSRNGHGTAADTASALSSGHWDKDDDVWRPFGLFSVDRKRAGLYALIGVPVVAVVLLLVARKFAGNAGVPTPPATS